MSPASLRITEVFTSIQGETSHAGRPCTFVRLTGCDLRCSWCDTEYAFTGGEHQSIEAVLAEVASRGQNFVTVTGGEPLLQPACVDLVTALLDEGHEVQVETGGHRDVSVLDQRARIILDVKAPASGESGAMCWDNVAVLKAGDEAKFVLAGRADYDWAKVILRDRLKGFTGTVLFHGVTGELEGAQLAGWILEDRLPVRFGLQVHTILWPGRTGV